MTEQPSGGRWDFEFDVVWMWFILEGSCTGKSIPTVWLLRSGGTFRWDLVGGD